MKSFQLDKTKPKYLRFWVWTFLCSSINLFNVWTLFFLSILYDNNIISGWLIVPILFIICFIFGYYCLSSLVIKVFDINQEEFNKIFFFEKDNKEYENLNFEYKQVVEKFKKEKIQHNSLLIKGIRLTLNGKEIEKFSIIEEDFTEIRIIVYHRLRDIVFKDYDIYIVNAIHETYIQNGRLSVLAKVYDITKCKEG